MTDIEQFRNDVIKGLSQEPKKLSSKYFYDKNGDLLFQEIMNLQEYYLTDSEMEIMKEKSDDLMQFFPSREINILELGAGDGRKTVHFLRNLIDEGMEVDYFPFDISADVLKVNESLMKSHIPELSIHPVVGDYFKTLGKLQHKSPNVILFLGSNLGNYTNEVAREFLSEVNSHMKEKDILLLGIDLKKNPRIIQKAYDDSEGVTKEFNLNLLARINRELGGDFDIEYFDHYSCYNPLDGVSKSFIVSMDNQVVRIGENEFNFANGEVIFTEISKKFTLDEVSKLGEASGFQTLGHVMDEKGWFSVSGFRRV